MGIVVKTGNRNSRGGAIRGITSLAPTGWSAPEAAERLASIAKTMGWSVESDWFMAEDLVCMKLEIGRLLRPGENKAAVGDRWIYRLIWEEIPADDRPNLHHSRMKIALARALAPGNNTWREAPSLKMITDLIRRNPAQNRPSATVEPIRTNPNTMAL